MLLEAPAGMFLRIDEADDVSGSIRHCLACYCLVESDPLAWKWIALSAHSEIQGASVCHLTGTGGVGALADKNTRDFLSYREAGRTDPRALRPTPQLAALPDLLKRIRKPHSAGDRRNEVGIALSDAELEWARRIHDDVRNKFTHFDPSRWSLDVSGLPSFTFMMVRVVRGIAEVGWAFRHKEREWIDALLTNLRALELKVSSLRPADPPATS